MSFLCNSRTVSYHTLSTMTRIYFTSIFMIFVLLLVCTKGATVSHTMLEASERKFAPKFVNKQNRPATKSSKPRNTGDKPGKSVTDSVARREASKGVKNILRDAFDSFKNWLDVQKCCEESYKGSCSSKPSAGLQYKNWSDCYKRVQTKACCKKLPSRNCSTDKERNDCASKATRRLE